jgi:hypothetical protein
LAAISCIDRMIDRVVVWPRQHHYLPLLYRIPLVVCSCRLVAEVPRGRVRREEMSRQGANGLLSLAVYGTSWSREYVLEVGVSCRTNDIQRVLSSPIPHLQFMLALSALEPSNIQAQRPPSSQHRSIAAPSMPSATFPSNQSSAPTASSSRRVLEDSNQLNGTTSWSGKGKSKADILKSWRTAQCEIICHTIITRLMDIASSPTFSSTLTPA